MNIWKTEFHLLINIWIFMKWKMKMDLIWDLLLNEIDSKFGSFFWKDFIKAKILLKFLEQMLAFVGDAEKFKKLKEKFCNGRRKYLASKRKRSSKK